MKWGLMAFVLTIVLAALMLSSFSTPVDAIRPIGPSGHCTCAPVVGVICNGGCTSAGSADDCEWAGCWSVPDSSTACIAGNMQRSDCAWVSGS